MNNKPLSFENIVAGLIVTIIGGVIVAYIIQDARFAPPPSTYSCDDLTDVELLDAPWRLEGKGGSDAGRETDQALEPDVLRGKDVLQIRIDLNGASFDEGLRKDESAIIIDQPDQNGQWTVASVVTHGIENGKDGKQVIYIPLTAFEGLNHEGIANRGHLDTTKPYGPLHARFWNETDFVVEIFSIVACNSKPGQ